MTSATDTVGICCNPQPQTPPGGGCNTGETQGAACDAQGNCPATASSTTAGRCVKTQTDTVGKCCFPQTQTPGQQCVDKGMNCAVNKQLCDNAIYLQIMTDNCAQTCNKCPGATNPGGACQDQNMNCANWAKKNFCASPYYSEFQKRTYCAQTCQLCQTG
ncbi:Protein Y39G8B.7 [Aphelenchoides avenae]|nr:Protein Y39G8B.7 [Aphelenchus avenae]